MFSKPFNSGSMSSWRRCVSGISDESSKSANQVAVKAANRRTSRETYLWPWR